LFLITDNHQRSHKSKLIIIVVATISGVLFLLAAAGCCCLWMKNKVSKKGEGEDMASSMPPSTAEFALPYRIRSQPSLSPVRDHKQLLDVSDETRYSGNDVDLPLFELEVILAATDNFADHKRIGAGGFGPVYMV